MHVKLGVSFGEVHLDSRLIEHTIISTLNDHVNDMRFRNLNLAPQKKHDSKEDTTYLP